MTASVEAVVTGAVEGDLDEIVLRQVVSLAGLSLGVVHGRQGKPALLRALPGYNNAAQYAPWIVVVDLDQDCGCAPSCQNQWLPNPAPLMRFRIAVRAVEAWLLADSERIAHFLRVSRARVPANPDDLNDPKDVLINVARHSRRSSIRAGIVPRERSGRRVGPLYNAIMSEFVLNLDRGWRPEIALEYSPSLARCVDSLRGIASLSG